MNHGLLIYHSDAVLGRIPASGRPSGSTSLRKAHRAGDVSTRRRNLLASRRWTVARRSARSAALTVITKSKVGPGHQRGGAPYIALTSFSV